MDFSGTQGELAIPMHATNVVASPYASSAAAGHVLHHLHRDHGGSGSSNNGGQQQHSPSAAALPLPPPPSPPPQEQEETTEISAGKKRAAAAAATTPAANVRYRECLKNHAAAIGGNATDGCGEFMPSGVEGSLEALKCSACGCHRNFHRKELDDDDDDDDVMFDAVDGFSGLGLGHHGHGHHRLLHPAAMAAHQHHKSHGGGGGGLLISGADPYGAYAAARALPPAMPVHGHHQHQHQHQQYVTVMPLSMMLQSESDEMAGSGGGGGGSSSAAGNKKRFRTKFTAEQKARMLEFAERVGWRLQRLDDAMVQGFCQEVGVKRRVLKVWMHNNKHNLATTTKRIEATSAAEQEQGMVGMADMASPPHMPLQMPAGVMAAPPPVVAASSAQAGPSSSCHRGGGPGSPMSLKLE